MNYKDTILLLLL